MGRHLSTGILEQSMAGQSRAFTRRLQSNSQWCCRGTRHHCGPQQTLQVEDQIEATASQGGQQLPPLPPAPPPAVGDPFIKKRMTSHQFGKGLTDHPRHSCRGKSFRQRPENRQRLDNVAERGGLDDRDPLDLGLIQSPGDAIRKHVGRLKAKTTDRDSTLGEE